MWTNNEICALFASESLIFDIKLYVFDGSIHYEFYFWIEAEMFIEKEEFYNRRIALCMAIYNMVSYAEYPAGSI